MGRLKPRVAVLFNQPSAGSDASDVGVLREVLDVATALRATGHEVQETGVDRRNLFSTLQGLHAGRSECVVFNLCEGLDDESRHEPTVAGLLSLFDLCFTGNAAATLTVGLDKRLTKAVLAASGVATPTGQVFRSAPRDEVAAELAYPLVVKPVREDASVGISAASCVCSPAELRRQVDQILTLRRQPALAEAYLGGREFNVAVTGHGKDARTLPVAEICFEGYGRDEPRLVTHAAKWQEGSRDDRRTVPRCPAELEPVLRSRLEDLAVSAYRALECRDYARVDLRLDVRGKPHVLEVNPNPDISRGAGLARSVAASGIDYDAFVAGLVAQAWERP